VDISSLKPADFQDRIFFWDISNDWTSASPNGDKALITVDGNTVGTVKVAAGGIEWLHSTQTFIFEGSKLGPNPRSLTITSLEGTIVASLYVEHYLLNVKQGSQMVVDVRDFNGGGGRRSSKVQPSRRRLLSEETSKETTLNETSKHPENLAVSGEEQAAANAKLAAQAASTKHAKYADGSTTGGDNYGVAGNENGLHGDCTGDWSGDYWFDLSDFIDDFNQPRLLWATTFDTNLDGYQGDCDYGERRVELYACDWDYEDCSDWTDSNYDQRVVVTEYERMDCQFGEHNNGDFIQAWSSHDIAATQLDGNDHANMFHLRVECGAVVSPFFRIVDSNPPKSASTPTNAHQTATLTPVYWDWYPEAARIVTHSLGQIGDAWDDYENWSDKPLDNSGDGYWPNIIWEANDEAGPLQFEAPTLVNQYSRPLLKLTFHIASNTHGTSLSLLDASSKRIAHWDYLDYPWKVDNDVDGNYVPYTGQLRYTFDLREYDLEGPLSLVYHDKLDDDHEGVYLYPFIDFFDGGSSKAKVSKAKESKAAGPKKSVAESVGTLAGVAIVSVLGGAFAYRLRNKKYAALKTATDAQV